MYDALMSQKSVSPVPLPQLIGTPSGAFLQMAKEKQNPEFDLQIIQFVTWP